MYYLLVVVVQTAATTNAKKVMYLRRFVCLPVSSESRRIFAR